jgi:thiol-disulfide isomerase/thioredoxin
MKTLRDSNNTIDSVRQQRPAARVLLLALPLVLGLLLLIGVIRGGLVSRSEPRPSSLATQTAEMATATATPVSPTVTPQPSPEALIPPVPTQTPEPDADVVAIVNGRMLDRNTLEIMQAADRAMAALLTQPQPAGDDVLERLVNGELVWQAAQAAGFAIEELHINQQLQGFLAARDKSMADLESALSANGLSIDDFRSYFARLLVIDQFSRTQAQNHGGTVSEYLGQLQREARISFGPAVEEAVAHAQAEAVQDDDTAHEATPEALTVTPMPDVVRGTATGQHAPLFDLPVLNYQTADSLSLEDLVGKPMLLSFWTTWCAYCQRQTPVLVDAHARYAEKVHFVGIDVKEGQQQVQDYVTANDIRYPIALDFDGQVASRYGVSGFPAAYFLDEEGRIVARYVGSLSSEQVESYLQQLLTVAGP